MVIASSSINLKLLPPSVTMYGGNQTLYLTIHLSIRHIMTSTRTVSPLDARKHDHLLGTTLQVSTISSRASSRNRRASVPSCRPLKTSMMWAIFTMKKRQTRRMMKAHLLLKMMPGRAGQTGPSKMKKSSSPPHLPCLPLRPCGSTRPGLHRLQPPPLARYSYSRSHGHSST